MWLKFRAFLTYILLLIKKLIFRKKIIGINPRIAIGKNSSINMEKGGSLIFQGQFVSRNNLSLDISKDGKISFGDKVFLNANCVLSSHENIEIGDRVQFGPGCMVFDNDHDYNQPIDKRATTFKTSPITIGKGTWIGAGSIILRGSKIGENCVIAAGSVIKGNITDNSIIIQKKTQDVVCKKC